MTARVNHLAVFVSAIVFFALGALWYTVLFGHMWLAAIGGAEKPMGSMGMTFAVGFVLGWILAYVIGIALADSSNPHPARHGVEFGLFMGIGVFATMSLMDAMYAGRGYTVWAIDAGYVVVGMAIMGAIIGAWRTKTVSVAA